MPEGCHFFGPARTLFAVIRYCAAVSLVLRSTC